MSSLRVTPLHADFGARVEGVDLARPLPRETREEILALIDGHSFLHFPGQAMDDEALIAFTRALGEPEAEHMTFGKTGEIVYLGTIGNVADDGTVKGNAASETRHARGNELWHSDSSFRVTPSFVTITHAHEVPGEGGATEFVSARAAFARLDVEEQERLAGLRVIHDYVFSRSQVAPVDLNHAASLPPVAHPLVRTNPRLQARNLYLGSHARSIVGWRGVDSRALIDRLTAYATCPEHIHAHRWQTGDTVIWDNRCLLHRGTPYDADRWRRRMRQTRVVGTESGETFM